VPVRPRTVVAYQVMRIPSAPDLLSETHFVSHSAKWKEIIGQFAIEMEAIKKCAAILKAPRDSALHWLKSSWLRSS